MSDKNSCILVAINPDDELDRIAERARNLVHGFNLPLIFIHIIDNDVLFDYANSFRLSGLLTGEYKQEEAEKEIMARKLLEEQLKTESHIHESLEIHSGNRAETIARFAMERHAEIIVLGQAEAQFGSVTIHLARYSPCDLHIVKLT